MVQCHRLEEGRENYLELAKETLSALWRVSISGFIDLRRSRASFFLSARVRTKASIR